MLQGVVYIRRLEFMQTGMRWWDIRRLGIEIYRRTLTGGLEVASVDDHLKLDDERRALQLPVDVITSGLTANPR